MPSIKLEPHPAKDESKVGIVNGKRTRFRLFMSERRNFVRVATLAFGILFASWSLSIVGGRGGAAWWLFVVAVAFAMGWVWAIGMWAVCKEDIRRNALPPESPPSQEQK